MNLALELSTIFLTKEYNFLPLLLRAQSGGKLQYSWTEEEI